MNKEVIMGILRHTLTFVGGFIIANNPEFGIDVQNIIGAAITVFGAVWSIINKQPTTGG